jgi:hypothetical protein
MKKSRERNQISSASLSIASMPEDKRRACWQEDILCQDYGKKGYQKGMLKSY